MKSLHRQRGLSLIAVAVVMCLLGVAAMGGLYWMRYERNPITDILNGKVGAAGKPALGMPGAPGASAGAVSDAPPPPPQPLSESVRKCIIDGKTVYSDEACRKSGDKVKLHDSRAAAPVKPKPDASEAAAAGSATLQQKAMDRAIENATK